MSRTAMMISDVDRGLFPSGDPELLAAVGG